MLNFDELINVNEIKNEYKKAFLMNIFRKMCVRFNNNHDKKNSFIRVYRESFNKINTIKILVEKEINYSISNDDAILLNKWFYAYISKNDTRKKLPQDLKNELFAKQKGKCLSCGEPLSKDWSKIHIDHIIPFKLVGDELEDNYQLLCENCNECKSCKTDYIFMKMINLD